MADGNSFWFAEKVPAETIISKVDPRANTKTPLVDTARLIGALTPLLGHAPPYSGLPFQTFTFEDEEASIRFTIEGRTFKLRLDTYAMEEVKVSEAETRRLNPQVTRTMFPRTGQDVKEVLSPDRRWFALEQQHNLALRSTYDGRPEPPDDRRHRGLPLERRGRPLVTRQPEAGGGQRGHAGCAAAATAPLAEADGGSRVAALHQGGWTAASLGAAHHRHPVEAGHPRPER